LRVALGAKTFVARAASSGRLAGLVIGKYDIPTDSAGQIRLYDTGPQPLRMVPAWHILSGDRRSGSGASSLEPDTSFERAIVFIGSSALGIEDVQHTPLSTMTLGVTIHAQAVEQILSRDFLIRPDWVRALEILVTVLAGIFLILVLRQVSALAGVAISLMFVASVLGLCWVAFSSYKLLVAPGFPIFVIAAVYLSCTINAYLVSERRRREVQTAFGQYLSPALIERLAADPGLLSLGGDTREVTILFCDIRGFTSLSERLDAQEVTRLVNRFLTAMSDAILDNGGTIDKYIGDCVMAFWNAPLDDPDHARQACRAAQAMRGHLRQLNEQLHAEAIEDTSSPGTINMGIGINTGDCCVGNMGSKQRFNYSALGDSVNLAARFEEETKKFGVDLVIGESTRQRIADLEFHELGRITVRGRAEPVRVFTLPDDS
jgi:adenylate cyclase